ncbi:hypothetical protein [Nocardia sp. NPDC058666]|uniref:hypothetical protein n=1 Tax=unclassified Nocardia TaxID=2637762 RepID=UPI0036691B45
MPESTVYTCRVTNWPMLWLAIAATVPVLAIGASSNGPWTGAAVPVAAGVVLVIAMIATATSLRVSTGPTGLTASFGVLGLPRFAYAAATIAHVEVIDIPWWSPWSWGMFWLPTRGWLLTLRSGPALRLRLSDGRDVTVSVTDPQKAMSTLGTTATQ